jgi:hypothetical protein
MLLGENFNLLGFQRAYISGQRLVLQNMVTKNCVWRRIPGRWRAIWSTMFRRILFVNQCFMGCHCTFRGRRRSCGSISKKRKISYLFCHIIRLQRCVEFRRNFIGFGQCHFVPGLVTQQKLLAAHCYSGKCRLIHKPRLEIRPVHS